MRASYAASAEALIREQHRRAAAVAQAEAVERELLVKPAPAAAAEVLPIVEPLRDDASRNRLRPRALTEVVGQEKLKPLLARLVRGSQQSGRRMGHMLFVGAAGTGKTTMASVMAHEVGTRIFALEAPLGMDVLHALAKSARDRDVIFVDEIHKQVTGDRRGVSQACDPESFYMLLEDGKLATSTGPVDFPDVTWIGATTDVGILPLSLSDRFPIKPRLAPYTEAEMTVLAQRNAQALRLACDDAVPAMFAAASRGVPRVVNNYMTAARDLTVGSVDPELAREVIEDLNSTTLDGLDASMQIVLRFLLTNCRRENKNGVHYTASVNTLATACGHGRDTKAINLMVEPYLLQRGLLEVLPTGRTLTPAGVDRARQLTLITS